MTGRALLGVDLGTSGVKAILLGTDGRLLAEAAAGYPVDSPRPGWAETDPPAWWRAVSTAVCCRALSSLKIGEPCLTSPLTPFT